MTIAEARGKCKAWAAKIPRDVLLVAILILASSLSFGLGYLAGQDARSGSSLTISVAPDQSTAGPESVNGDTTAPGQVVASKSGTKYYFPTCSGAARISDANKVWFISAAAAAAAGYSLAANCKGL